MNLSHKEKILAKGMAGAARFRAVSYSASGILLLVLLTGGCARVPAADIPWALSRSGTAAANITGLWWILFGLGTAVFVVVIGLLLYIIFTRRQRLNDDEVDLRPVNGRPWILWGGIIIPLIILLAVFFFNMRSLIALASPGPATPLTVEVIGHRWWWEVRYPDENIVTANEIRIPVGQPVQFNLTSFDVIHSFWVPQLGGKMDLNPGEVNSTWLQANERGVYRGLCAEFCGLQHARMQFLVVVESEEEFNTWLVREREPAPEPADELIHRGQQIFLGSACVYCHTVRGTNASGDLGPDLTHLASRLSLAAGILENNRGNLAAWIVDPQHLKPGNLMPPTNLNGEELQALLAYLETLE